MQKSVQAFRETTSDYFVFEREKARKEHDIIKCSENHLRVQYHPFSVECLSLARKQQPTPSSTSDELSYPNAGNSRLQHYLGHQGLPIYIHPLAYKQNLSLVILWIKSCDILALRIKNTIDSPCSFSFVPSRFPAPAKSRKAVIRCLSPEHICHSAVVTDLISRFHVIRWSSPKSNVNLTINHRILPGVWHLWAITILSIP